jgi:hypothetical protein
MCWDVGRRRLSMSVKESRKKENKVLPPMDPILLDRSLWTGEADTWVVLGVTVRGLNARVILCIALTVAGLDS